MNKSIIVAIVSLVIGCTLSPVQAAVRAWELDKAHSNFYFSVDHIFSKIQGNFTEYSGSVLFDPENLDASKFEFAIKVKSINTGIGKRDKHLQSPDFFDQANHPDMTFQSTKITKSGDSIYNVAGTFTVKGVEYDLVLPLEFGGSKGHPMDKKKDVAGFNGRLTLDRLAYKIGTGQFLDYGVVGKDVDILVTLELLSDR